MVRILIVEDDREVNRELGESFSRRGWQVQSAFDGMEAWERVQREPFDLVLTDIGLPGLNGLELLDRLRESRLVSRVMVMTSASTPEPLVQALKLRACAFFRKPFSAETVAETVAQDLSMPPCKDDLEVLSAAPNWISLKMRCKVETADRLVRFLRELKMDLPASERDAIASAFREILLNAIEHGARSDPDKRVYVSYFRTSRAVVYYIRDPGQGFSFAKLPHAAVSNAPGLPLEHAQVREELGLRPGGFGILLARNLVDELLYNEQGNEVLLIKYSQT